MSQDDRPFSRPNRFRWVTLLFVLVLFAGAAIVYATTVRNRGTPKLVNRPTAARQVRPLSEKADKRFAPLPIEEEKHSK